MIMLQGTNHQTTAYAGSVKIDKYDVQQARYDGPKKPAMPPEQALNDIPTFSFLASQAITVQRAVKNDSSYRTYILNQNVMNTILDYVGKPP